MVPYSQYQSSDYIGSKVPISGDRNIPKSILIQKHHIFQWSACE